MAYRTMLIAVIAITGCAAVNSSGVNQIGPDTYAITVLAGRAHGGIIGAESIALQDARSHCQRLAREILVVNSSTATGAYQATFRCLLVGDQDLQRPAVLSPPDRIIERRERILPAR